MIFQTINSVRSNGRSLKQDLDVDQGKLSWVNFFFKHYFGKSNF